MGDLRGCLWSVNPQSNEAMTNSNEWYYLDKDRQIAGPVNHDTLRQLAAAGVISDETLVAVAGSSDWVPFLHVDSLDLQSDTRNPREDVQVEWSNPSIIKLKCPGCGQRLSVTPDKQDMTFRCPKCNGRVVIQSTVQPTKLLDDHEATLKVSPKQSAMWWLLSSPLAPWLFLLLFFVVRFAGLKLGWISFGTPVLSPACWVIAGLPIFFILAGHFFGSGGQPRKMPVLSSASCGLYGVVFLIWLIVFIMPTWPRNLPGTWKSVVEPDTEIVFDAKGGYQQITIYPDGSGGSKAGRWAMEGGRLVLSPLDDLGKSPSKYDLTARGFAEPPDDEVHTGWGYGQLPQNNTAPVRSGTPAFARLTGDSKTWQTALKEMMSDGFDPARGEAMITEQLMETRDGVRILIADQVRQQLEVLVELEFGDRALRVQSYNSTGQWPDRSKDAVPAGVNVFLPVNNISGGFKKSDIMSDGQLQVGVEPTKWEKRLEVLLDELASRTADASRGNEALVWRIKEPAQRAPGDPDGWGVYFFYADPAKATYVIFQNAFGLSGNGPWSGEAAPDAKRFAEVVDPAEYVFGAHEIHLWRHLLTGMPRYRELAKEVLSKRLGDVGAAKK